jgi:aldose 1-epimerase
MIEKFGELPNGQIAHLYTISCGELTAKVADLGATLVRMYVPGKNGTLDDVVLGYDSPAGYLESETYFGATVGRNANRVHNSCFVLGGKTWSMPANEGSNCLHSGPNGYNIRLWKVVSHQADSIIFSLESPHGDQGMPGNATIQVTYKMEQDGIRILYDAVSDQDTVFNFTNHSYFNLAGHTNQDKAMDQLLSMPARFFLPDDAANIPTGEMRSVEGTPMDFRIPKALGRDIHADYESLHLQGGYDHNFEVFCNPAATLTDTESGRSVAVYTDCPGIQIYTANFTKGTGKDGVTYQPRCGVCLETQFYPDSVNHPEWQQPFVKAGKKFHSETKYRLSW